MLTVAQLLTLKAAIAAETDPAFVANRTAGNTGLMAEWYNGASSKIAWRTSVPQADCMNAAGFDWTQADNLTAGQARIWEWLFANDLHSIDASKAQIRAGVSECWKGTAAKVAVATAVLGACKRAATRGEALYATGTGTSADPALLVVEGTITNDDIVRALAS